MPQKIQRKSETKATPVLDSATLTEIKRKRTLELQKISSQDKMELMTDLGLGTEYFTCYRCNRVTSKKGFYMSTDRTTKSPVSPICKECAEELAYPCNQTTGEKTNPTIESCKNALFYLNRAWRDDLWQSSLLEAANEVTGKNKNSVWTALIKNTSLPHNIDKTWRDGDMFNTNTLMFSSEEEEKIDKTILESFGQNKEDAARLLGYEPFIQEAPADQPFLYAQLIAYLDNGEEGNKDPMRISSIIEIIRGFDHRNKINNMIAEFMKDKKNITANIGTIRALEETKQKIGADIQKLAQESKISLNSNKTIKKGESTWSGQLKKLKEKKLRSAEENAFDIGVCQGMRQVADLSDMALINRISLDETMSADIIVEQRRLLTKFKYAYQDASEIARLLLRENDDLKIRLKMLDKDFDSHLKPLDTNLYISNEVDQIKIEKEIQQFKGVDIGTLYEEDESQYEVVVEEESEELVLEDGGDVDGI